MIGIRVLLVAAGGTIGAAARLALDLLIPDSGFPLAILVANVVGALLLGILTARVRSTQRRLLVGTGVLGGFTTYSALTVGVIDLWQSDPLLAAVYAVGSILAGVSFAALGLRLGRTRRVRA